MRNASLFRRENEISSVPRAYSGHENKAIVGPQSAFRLEVIPVSPAGSYGHSVGGWVEWGSLAAVVESDSGGKYRRVANKVIITIAVSVFLFFSFSKHPLFQRLYDRNYFRQ